MKIYKVLVLDSFVLTYIVFPVCKYNSKKSTECSINDLPNPQRDMYSMLLSCLEL